MKFLCLDCDEPMRLLRAEGPDDGSLSVTFRCPQCGFRVAMLTNPFETQMVRSLGVKIGGRTAAAEPFEHLRASMAGGRTDAFEGQVSAATPAAGSGCPFAEMISNPASAPPARMSWTAAAEARIERIPSFIRPMARTAIERYAESKGYAAITEEVLEEARGAMGM
jgi:hypothetical protein